MFDHSLPRISLKRMHYFSQFSSGGIDSEFRTELCLPTREGSKTENAGGPDSSLLSEASWARSFSLTEDSRLLGHQPSTPKPETSYQTALSSWCCGYFRVHLTVISRAGEVWESGFHLQTFSSLKLGLEAESLRFKPIPRWWRCGDSTENLLLRVQC